MPTGYLSNTNDIAVPLSKYKFLTFSIAYRTRKSPTDAGSAPGGGRCAMGHMRRDGLTMESSLRPPGSTAGEFLHLRGELQGHRVAEALLVGVGEK